MARSCLAAILLAAALLAGCGTAPPAADAVRLDATPRIAVVSSALWNMEPTIDTALKKVKDGKFGAEDYGHFSTMKHKGSELAPLGTFEKKVPADIVSKVKAKEKAIQDGKFAVKVDDTQPKSGK